MDLTEGRRAMVRAMGSRCSDCGNEFDPDMLIIHHSGFERGERLGYQSPQRNEEVREFMRTGKIPEGSKLLCDSCNRKKHKYRPSKRDIFGDRLRRPHRLMFRKPENTSVVAAYEWSNQITGESQNWVNEYYWSKPMKILRAKLPLAKKCLLAITGLQGTGKTIGLKMLASAMEEASHEMVCFKWTKDWIEQLLENDERLRKIYREECLENAFYQATNRKKSLLQVAATMTQSLKSSKTPTDVMEKIVGKTECRELEKEALLSFFISRRFIFIDMPDYSKSDSRFMSVDFDELQALWNSIIENSYADSEATIIVTMQKELSKGKHFFLGKFDVTELPLLEPKELIETYKKKFESIEPFAEETLDLIAKLSRGVFRRFQKYCRLTIEEFLVADKEPPITIEYAERAITETIIFNDMELEMFDKFKNEGQRKLAVEMLSFLTKKRGEEVSQKQIAEALDASEMAVSRVIHVLASEKYITRDRGKDGRLLLKMLG
jgi:biotin operon repressor